MEALDVTDHHGDYIVRTKFEGDYDKANLPDPLIMTNYIAPRDGKIITPAGRKPVGSADLVSTGN